jgi:integrase
MSTTVPRSPFATPSRRSLRLVDADLERDGVGPEAVRRTLAMLQGILGRAVEWQLISDNPVKAIRKPRTKRKHAVQVVPPLAVERLRSTLLERGRRLDAVLASVLAYAGVRPVEALALEWRHVRERTLLVEQKNVDGEILGGQKTERPPRRSTCSTSCAAICSSCASRQDARPRRR